MIDLRSDTVTRPTAGMLQAMSAARVGDDVFGEDPTVNELQERMADLTGHEAALFVGTGSLANLLGVWTLVPPGRELLCEEQAHVVRAELGAHASLHGVTTRTWRADSGVPGIATTDQIRDLLAPPTGPFLVNTAAIALENTHNFGGGTIQPIDHLRAVSQLCRQAEVGMHLDGARLWNAHVATGIPVREYTTLFDTATLCFSKGLGAPIGSVLVGSREAIDRARIQRKRLGGGWRQAGLLAAAALYALEHHLDQLAADHAAAAVFAAEVASLAPAVVDLNRVETNIVLLDTGSHESSSVVSAALVQGVGISAVGRRIVRAVTHRDVSNSEAQRAGRIVGSLLAA